MTSTNDGKEVKSYQTSGPRSKTYFIELYKSLESRLSGAESAGERSKHLCEAWRRVHSLCQHSAATTHPHLLSWLQRHTARAVLQTKWQSPEHNDDRRSLEEAINVFIVESNVAAASRDGDTHQWEAQLVARGEWFKKILKNPWKHPVLNCLLNPDDTPLTDNEVLEWLKEERGVTFVMRLHTLVAEKCDDIALSLATAVMERVRSGIRAQSDLDQSDDGKDKPEQNASSFGERLKEEAGFTVDVWEMLTDIEFVLLHKRDSSQCITLAKQTPLRSAYQLIERLQSRLDTSPRDKRLWKNSKEVAILIAQVVITRCMMVPACAGASRSALYCCARSLARLLPRGRLAAAAAALAAPAPTAAHLHTLAAAIDAQLAQKNEAITIPFVCELYVRAMTAGMNELERLKLKTEKEKEARSMEQTIGSWFVQLGAVLGSSERVKRECVLTAFSLHPSPQMYERIKALPALPPIIPEEETSKDANPGFSSWASDSRSQTNFVKTSETLKMKARQNQANVLSTAILTEGEALGLSPELCQDITVLLSGPRVKTLSWDMDRELLLENCRAYLELTHGGTKAVTTELKYLNINPADFQYLPEEDDEENNIYYGIEKGYEHLVEFQEPEDFWEEAYDKADTAYIGKASTSYSSDEFDFIQPQRRRKPKKPALKSDEDDPLSFVAETKRKEKKERPHSKERSKEKKKAADTLDQKEPGDPLEIRNQEQKKDKPKRVRKKKAPKPTDGSLANLVGLKVGNSTNSMKILVADSDADSQGQSSVRSINSEENVLYDGVFSMDDMRSPRSSHSSDSLGMIQTNESLMSSGQVGNNPKPIVNRPYRPASVSDIRIASPSPSKSHSPADRSRNDSPISDEVKGSLTKLLEYRRQKALEDQHRKPNAIRPHSSMAMDKINISPKGVAIPEIPKSYISKQSDNTTMLNQMDHKLNQRKPSTAIPSPVIQYASKPFTSPDKLSQSHYGPRQYNNVQADRMAPSDRCFSTPPSSDKFLDSVNLISIYDKLEQTPSLNPFDKSSTHPEVSQDNQRRSNVDTSYINYQDYVHEFSLNAYNQYTEHRDASKKVISANSIVSPVVSNKNSEYKSPQSTKQMTQKKPDGSLNTFARMSYYKNKQTDMRKSQDIAQHHQPQTVGSKMEGFIMDHLLNSQKPATSEASVQALKMRLKTETPQTTTANNYPMLSNILHGNLSQVQKQQRTISPPKSVISEKDHDDLLLLLRQQNALNKPQNIPAASCSKRNPTLISPLVFGSKCITSSSDANYESNTSLVSASFVPNQQSGKPNEVVKKVAEGKIINVLSTSIIKTADKPKDSKTKPTNTKKSIEYKPKKTKSRGSKKIVPKPEPRQNPEEWENVMNAILKQKTPCRGPNALDMALNKSSFEKAFEESLRKPSCLFRSPRDNLTQSTIISQTESIHEEFVNITQSSATTFSSQTVTKTQQTTYTPLKIPCGASLLKKNPKPKKSVKTPLKVTSTVETLLRQQKIDKNTIERLMQNNNIEITKHTSSITLLEIPERSHKLRNVEKPVKQQRHIDNSKINVQHNHAQRLKKTVNQNYDEPKKHDKQIVSEIPEKESKQGNVQSNQLNDAGLKQDDPIMPGIPNSDYDLLDELMDDDLRKEIGEISSDEETYHAQDFIKDTKLDQTRLEVKYNHANIDNASVAPISSTRQPICKQNQILQSIAKNPTQRQQSNEPVLVAITPVRSAQNKPAMCLNSTIVQNVSTQVMSRSIQARACNSASVLRSSQMPVETNQFIAVPRLASVQNVMPIPSELTYENYLSAQSSIQTVPNIALNTNIATTNTSNTSVDQPTQFVEPTVRPLIITSAAHTTALIAPGVNNVNIATGQPQPVIKVTQTEYCLSSNELHQPFHLDTAPGNIIVAGNKLETKITSCLHNVSGTDIQLKSAEVKTSADENEGKSSGRKVLKEVQEKHADEKISCENNQPVTNKSQKATANYLKTQADQDRLEKKRMAILNRNISNFCGIKTIALGYSPLLLPSTQNRDDHAADINDAENYLTTSNKNNIQEASNEMDSPATPDSCKENKSEPTQAPRILLRSSNKFKSKISGLTSSPKPSLAQKLKKSTAIPSNTLSETPCENEKIGLEIDDKQKRVSKRIRNKSVTTPKDTLNDETKLEVKVQKKTTGTPKVSKRKVRNAASKINTPTTNNSCETKNILNVESELASLTIQTIKPICLSRPDPDPTCLGDKLVETLNNQEDKLLESLSGNKTTMSADLTEFSKVSVNVTNETREINTTVNDLNEGVISSIFGETTVQENETTVTQEKYENVKEITSSGKLSLHSDMVKTDLTPEILSPMEKTPIPQEKHHTPSNITNNEIAQESYDNGDIYDVKQNSAQNNHHDENTVGQKQKTHENVKSNINHNIVVPQSQLVTGVDHDDDIEIIGDIPNNPQTKYIQSKPSPDSIVIEHISSVDDIDPQKKRVRIKLGNGKVFKGTVSGSVNVNTLLDDPKIKALLMSQLEQSKSLYSLRLNVNKNLSNGTQILSAHVKEKPKPHLPMETVSLLSDDEENDSPKLFETEYGKHKIAPMDDNLFKKHQKKLMVKSYVPVKKLSLDEVNAVKLRIRPMDQDHVSIPTQILEECVNLDDNESPLHDTSIFAAIPSKYVQGVFDDIDNILTPTNTDSKEESVVLIDDSSNDSIDIKNKPQTKEKIDVLKDMLLKDLGVDNFMTSANETPDDVQVTWDSEAIDLTDEQSDLSHLEPPEITGHTPQLIDKEDYKKMCNRECFVKLVRFDDPPKSQPVLVKDDELEEINDDIIPAPLSRSGSFSILEELPAVDELNKKTTEYEQSRSSPVMEIYDLIASLEKTSMKRNILDLSEVPLKCYTEWMTTKRDENLKSLNVTMKLLVSQTPVVPKLSMLALSFIQKEDLVNKNIFHTSLISLKRKTMPSSLPAAKMSKLKHFVNEPHSYVSTLTLDLSDSLVTKEIDHEIEAFIKNKEELKTEEQKTIADTSNLSDTDETTMTVTDYSDDDLEFEEKRESYTAKNIPIDKILDLEKYVAVVCHTNNETELENKVSGCHKSIVDSMNINPDLTKNCVTDFYKLQKITKETLAEFPIDPVDDIHIDLDIIKKIEEPELIQTDLDQVSVNKDNTECQTDFGAELDHEIIERQNKFKIYCIDVNPELSKNIIADISKEQSSMKILKETSVNFLTDLANDIPIDLQTDLNQASIDQNNTECHTDFETDLHQSSIDQNNTECQTDFGAESDHEMIEVQNKFKIDSIDVNPDISKNTIADISKEQLSRKISKETSVEFLTNPVNDIPIDLQTDLDQASIDRNNTVCQTDFGAELDHEITEMQNKFKIDSIDVNPDLSKNTLSDFSKELSSRKISTETSVECLTDLVNDIPIDVVKQTEEPDLIQTDRFQISIDENHTACHTHDGGKVLYNKVINIQNNLINDSDEINSDIYRKNPKETQAKLLIEDNYVLPIDLEMKQVVESVLIKTDLLQIHIDKSIVSSGISQDMHDTDLGIVGVTKDQVSRKCQSERLLLNTHEVEEDLDTFPESVTSRSVVNKYIVEEIKESKGFSIFKEEGKTLDVVGTHKNASVYLEIPLQKTTDDPNVDESTREPLNDQKSSGMCFRVENQLMDQNIFAKTYSSEKTALQTTIYENNEPVVPNLSKESSSKQRAENNFKSQKFNQCDMPDNFNQGINMQEPTNIENTYKSNETLCNKNMVPLENEDSDHKFQQSVEHSPTKQNTISKATHFPKTNDEIVEAMNQIFGEKSDNIYPDKTDPLLTCGHKKASKNREHNCCNDSNQKDLFDDDIKSIERLTMSEEVREGQIGNTVIRVEKSNEDHIAHIPKTTDEIVTALKKMFGEADDSMHMSEVVGPENLENVSRGKIPIIPNDKELAIKAPIEHHVDAMNGLLLMEESDCDTVVEGIVDMLSDEIIGDITVVNLNCNKSDIKNIEKDNLEENIVADDGTFNNEISDSSNENLRKSLNCYMEPNGQVDTKDPAIETFYVVSVLKESADATGNDSEIKDCEENDDIKLIIPQHSYSSMKSSDETIRRSSRNMKRKKDMTDIKTVEKKYRKGKNIDYPKTTALAIADLAYAKEYKRIIDYCSTIKFSYARPFHIECIDVHQMLKSWPIIDCSEVEINDPNSTQELLYRDTEDTENAKVQITDPLKQTLNEEIVNGENINSYESIDINETNFNMGFGEMSGRVIQKIETGITKLSAATLSDVKQYQPCSMSKVNESYFVRNIDTQKSKISDFTNLINIKEKIRSFFKKTEVELANELLQNKKYKASDHHLSKFPFCLTGTEFMEFPRMKTVVNVVQVGQLPVSSTVQNTVTCDPRVTHVSDASPSHCSDNSTGDDTHSTVETEYTELTTANITLPLVQEYAHNHLQSPPSQEQNSTENNDEPHDTSFSIVKIELMEETSQENFETDIYDNDFSPLPNNNIEYSFEDTSNTLFNASLNLHNTSKTDNTSNNVFNTTTTMDTGFTNIMFDHTTNMNSAYSIDNTPSSTESTYTNMDNASSSMYKTSPSMGNPSTARDDTVNLHEASSNMDTTTNIDDSSASNTYSNKYNPMGSDSNDVNDTASNINDSPIELENRNTNMNSTSNIENATYNYTYENIEDYAANIENNNNDNYASDVDNFDAVEKYSANVDDYASNVENYELNDESYRAGVEKYASNIENYATHIENYSTNVENYTNNVDNTDTNANNNLTNVHNSTANILEEPQDLSMTNSSLESKSCSNCEDDDTSKINQIEHAMDAAGIAAESVITSGADELANLITQSAHAKSDHYSKSTPINVMTLQQALAHVLPPPLNQTSTSENPVHNNPVPQQVLHIVQGNNPQTVINKGNGTHLLHIVQNKNNPANNGLSVVDTGLQQGGNQLIHIVNNGNQNNAQFLKRVNLLTNLTNAQGSNEQKMIQLVCKSADGKSIQLNTGPQRSMVLRLHPTTVQAAQKTTEQQDLSTASPSGENSANGQDPCQDIKSRSVYEENYAQFIQNSGSTPGSLSTTPCQEKATSLPKFNQVFGKQSYQENQNEIKSGLQENTDCSPDENNSHLEQAAEANGANPPLVARIAPTEATQDQHSPAQQIKQTLSPMNIHTTMHGGVIYTRQIPVNIGGRQTINLITVPTTELDEDSTQKQQSDSNFVSQEGEQSSIIKLVPHHTSNNNVPPEVKNTQASTSNETSHNPQPVLTQMRIKLPMLSKGHHIVPGARLVRPSFFQIQRNVIAGTNQPVYQQLVLTTAPPHGQIRLPTHSPQGPPLLVQTSQHPQSSPHIPVQQVQHAPSSQHVTVQQTRSASRTPQPHSVPLELTKPDAVPESELSTLTLEQLREFDMVLEQVKERSVQPTPSTTPSANPCTPADSTDGPALATTSVSESIQQVRYSVENSQPTNVVSYVNRKSTITSATTSFVRSPDSSGIVDSPSSSTQVHITHTVTSKSSTSDGGSAVASQPKKKKKKKPPPSTNTMASLGSPSKTNPLKPQEDEQTTQRILYILAEYKEQVENSPDKNKPAPRRRNQFPPTVGSKRKRHCSSRATCRREGASPMHGEPGELGDDLITLGSEDSSCGTTFSECMDCQEIHSPDSPTKVVRKLTFEETTTQITQTQSSQQPQRNVIVGDRQTITVARTTTATSAKPTTTVLMPANYILPVSMLKGGQQIAIMTNRGPKILVGAGDNNTGALLIQRLITPGLKPVLTRPGVRHIRLPTTTLHNLQAFNIQTTPVTQVQPPDSTAPQTPMPGPPDLVEMRTTSTPWQDREAQDKPTRGPSPDCTEPWNLPSSSIADDYGYEEIVRTDTNMERTVLVVQQRKDGRHHRVTHVSTAALRHKYAILEHELRLQKSLSEECEDLGVDSPSASELFPEADILFGAPSPAHEQTIDQCSTPPPIPMPPQPELDDQIAADIPLAPTPRNDDLNLNLDDDVGEIVTVGEDGIATIPIINAEEFARSHPNTTFHTEPEDGEIPPFTIAQSIKGRHITFHANRVPGTVVMAPQTTVISQATVNNNDHNTVKFIDIDNMINSLPCPQPVTKSVLVKDTGNTRPQSKFDSLKEPGPSNHKSSSKSDSQKNLAKSRTSSKFDSSKDSGTFAPRTKFDNLKDPNTSNRSSSKFDSVKDSGSSAHKSSSKFDSLREPGLSASRSGSKFDSLKDPGISTSRSSAKYDKETGSRPYSNSNQKDSGNLAPKPLSKFDSLLTESKQQLSSNTSARQVVHSTGHGTQVIRRLRYEERTNTRPNTKFHFEHPRRRSSISDEVKMRNDRAIVESMGDNASSPGQPELFWDSTSTERPERRFHISEGEKVTKSPFDELLNDSSAYGPHTRLDSVIKAPRPERTYERTSFEGISISGSADETRPIRTYPPKRAPMQHTQDTERHFTLKTTSTTTHQHEVDRTTTKTTHHHEVDRTKNTRCQESEGRRRTGRGLVKRGCSCCNGSQSAPPKKRSRPKKPPPELPPNKTDP